MPLADQCHGPHGNARYQATNRVVMAFQLSLQLHELPAQISTDLTCLPHLAHRRQRDHTLVASRRSPVMVLSSVGAMAAARLTQRVTGPFALSSCSAAT